MTESSATVAVDSVYLRDKPGGIIIGSLHMGDRVKILGTVKHKVEWAHVQVATKGGKTAYSLASAFRLEDDKPPKQYPPDAAPIEHHEPLTPYDYGPWAFLGGLALLIFLLWLFGAF